MSCGSSKTLCYQLVSVILLVQVLSTDCYKPVIIFHGLLDAAEELADLKSRIETVHEGTQVYVPDLFDYYWSFTSMRNQLESFRNFTDPIMKQAKDGVHVIGFSQGGLLARGLIETTDDHNVDSFVSLSAPINGQYGDTSYVNKVLPKMLKKDMYKVFYTEAGQLISVGNYWRDPHHMEGFRTYSSFLAPLNNESSTVDFIPSWRSNFGRLGNLVLIGGPDDGIITPWQSAQFGCFNASEQVVPMRKLKIYEDDVFGLKSLDRAGHLHECTFGNVQHTTWHKNKLVFDKCIEPWLT